MPPVVEPTYGRAVISPVLSLANDYSGDYVVPDDQDAIAATAASVGGVDVTAGPHNAFAYDPGNSSGLTVRIDTGEAFVGGRYLVSDDVSATRVAVDGSTVPVHDVDLPANATTTVSIGPDDRANSVATDQLIIGLDSAFPTAETPRLPLYDFTTDGSSVTGVADRRRTGKAIDVASVTTEQVASTKSFALSNADYNPYPTRSFEQSGVLSIRPHPSVSNPVLTGSDVTDRAVTQVADPFIVYDSGVYHMFMETFNDDTDGDIGHATSIDGLDWTYDTTVLGTPEHLSWPLVFKWDGTWYMIPGTKGGGMDIYRGDPFPTTWTFVETAMAGEPVGDYILFPWNGRWYAITYDGAADTKNVYYSDTFPSLTGGTWTAHPQNPIYTGGATDPLRNGGRPIVREDFIDVFYQQQNQAKTRYHRITTLTTDTYDDTEVSTSPITQYTRQGWNANRMHHVDAMMPYVGGNDVVVVDGGTDSEFAIGIYTSSDQQPMSLRAYPTGRNQSFPSGNGWHDIPLQGVDHDVSNAAILADDHVTIPTAGYYYVGGAITFQNLPNEEFTVRCRLYDRSSGSELSYATTPCASGAGSASAVAHPVIVALKEGAEIVLQGFQDSSTQIDRSGQVGTSISVSRVW